MADQTSHGIGGLTYDKSKRAWPNEANVFIALILIILAFEALGQILPYMNGQSMLFDFNTSRDGTILNIARIKIVNLAGVDHRDHFAGCDAGHYLWRYRSVVWSTCRGCGDDRDVICPDRAGKRAAEPKGGFRRLVV